MASDNLGRVLLYAFSQSVLLAYALARALELLRKLRVSRTFRLFASLFFALTPIFASFAQAVGKDTIYAALVLLFTYADHRMAALRQAKDRRRLSRLALPRC